MRRKFLLHSITLFVFLLGMHNLGAQTFSNTGSIIPDDGSSYYDTIAVSGLPFNTLDTSFGLLQVCMDIQHTYDSDLSIWLIAPDGTTLPLSLSNGGSGDNYQNTCFTGTATTPIIAGTPPFTGSFLPQGWFGDLNNHQNGNGNWVLHIIDGAPQDQGILNNWSITFGTQAQGPFVFTSTLPIVVVNTTGGVNIPDEPKVPAMMHIINNGIGQINHLQDVPQLAVNVGIEQRGSSSASFPQKSYGFEIRDASGAQMDTVVLGMPSEHDWILYAPYDDKSLMRNVMAYRLYTSFGRWAARTQFCEVVLNGSYQGIYVLMEKIKRDKNRVNISKLTTTDTSGVNVTGGYIFKVDKETGANNDGWYSGFPKCSGDTTQPLRILYDYPAPTTILPSQKNYIHSFVDSFEQALRGPDFQDTLIGFRRFAGEKSFIDHMILVEIGKNVDGYRLSTYLYKEKQTKGGKIKAGPVWDYNLAFGNADYYDGAVVPGWRWDCYNGMNDGLPFWWQRLTQDTMFMKNMRCRYTQLRDSILSDAHIDHLIDSVQAIVQLAQPRHFQLWNLLGHYVWPNAYVPATFQGEIDTLRGWFHSRLRWMDTQLLTTDCPQPVPVGVQAFASNHESFVLSPNPVASGSSVHIDYRLEKSSVLNVQLYAVTGNCIWNWQSLPLSQGIGQLELPIPYSLPAGVYFIHLRTSTGTRYIKFVVGDNR